VNSGYSTSEAQCIDRNKVSFGYYSSLVTWIAVSTHVAKLLEVLEHETSNGCDKSKATTFNMSDTLWPSTVTGHGPGMHIDVEGLGDSTAAALVDAALAATATQHSGNSIADSKRKRRELGPAVELPGVPPAASPAQQLPSHPPRRPAKKERFRAARPRGAAGLHGRPDGAVRGQKPWRRRKRRR
jgi:hypothetical protein